MTATVAKGANRPSAMARSAKHAQTTPLPPKGEQTRQQAERQEIAEQNARRVAFVEAHNTLGWSKGMSLTGKIHWATLETRGSGQHGYRHLNQVCGATGARAYASLDLVPETRLDAVEVDCKRCQNAMAKRAAERADAAEIQAAKDAAEAAVNTELDAAHGVTPFGKGKRTRKDSPKAEPVAETPAPAADETPAPKRKRGGKAPSVDAAAPAGDTKAHKAAGLPEFAGWTAEVQVDGDYAELVARRGTEVIHLTWIKGVYQAGATYTIGDRTVQIRNLAEARRWALRSAEEAEQVFSKVVSNRAFRRREVPEEEQGRTKLPFTLDAPEKTVLDALAGRKVRWHNRYSSQPEVAVLDTDPRRLRMQEMGDGERVVLFCSPGHGGFRAFRLSALLAVK